MRFDTVPATGPSAGDLIEVTTSGGRRHDLEYVPDTLARIAREAPDTPAITMLAGSADGGAGDPLRGSRQLSYGDLEARVRAVAAVLRRRCGPAERAAILCAHDEHYIVAFLACLHAGVVGIPLHAPEFFRGQARLRSILADSAPAVVLTNSRLDRSVRGVLADTVPHTDVVHVDTVDDSEPAPWNRPAYQPDQVAYLQYTSGSTRAPAGVRISHRNLTAAAWQLRTHFMPARSAVSWVPLFHDMGLICGVVSPVCAGIHMVHLSPLQFIRDPFLWLDTVSRTRADWTVAPNFALQYCVHEIDTERAAALDLGSLGVLAIGGEMVRAETLTAFTERFSATGLRPSALTPSYGLAEATLTVAVSPRGVGNQPRAFDRSALAKGKALPANEAGGTATRLVGCAEHVDGARTRIVDPDTCQALAPGLVGEVWVSGPNCSDGYWGDTDVDRFSARLALSDDETTWVRTRDAGFTYDGVLYIVGRLDDVIVLRGENHYPEDLESTIEDALPGTRPVVIAVDTDAGTGERQAQPRIVVLLESRRRPGQQHDSDQVAIVRRVVSREHGLTVSEVAVLRQGSLPRTTSGKPRRAACRERYLAATPR